MIKRIKSRRKEEIGKFYDSIFIYGGYENPNSFKKWIIKISEKKYGKLLDVACGNGNFMEYAEKFFDCYGVDISKEAIRKAKKRTKKSRFKITTAEKLNFKKEYFDVVTCLGSMEHFVNIDKSLKEMKRVLKDDGVAILHVPNSKYLVHKILRIDTQGQINERLATEKEWRKIIEKNFKVKKVYKHNTRWFLKWIPKKYCCHFTFVCTKN